MSDEPLTASEARKFDRENQFEFEKIIRMLCRIENNQDHEKYLEKKIKRLELALQWQENDQYPPTYKKACDVKQG